MKSTPNDCPLDQCPHYAPELRESTREYVEELKNQNKELLEALKKIYECGSIKEAERIAQDTIAKADR
jgi:hypothetical protein